MPSYTTTELVAAIKRRGSLPTNQQLFTANDFINLANDEMELTIVPMLMSAREEYFVTYKDFTVTPSSTGPAVFEIPADAVGMKLRNVCWVTPGNGVLSSIPFLSNEQIAAANYDFLNLSGFGVEGNKILLYPSTAQGTGTLRMYYMRRPLQLISTSAAGQVTSINTMANEVTLSFVPNDWQVGDVVNFVNDKQPFDTKVVSLEITSLSSPTVGFASIEDIEVGQWCAQEGFSPIPQIPIEAHKVLAQATVVKCLEAMGDKEGMQVAEAKLQQNIEAMFKIIGPRVDGAPKKVTTANNGIFDWSSSYVNRRGVW